MYRFHDDDGIVDDQSDGQHKTQQGEYIDRKSEQREKHESADQCHRNHDQWNESRPEILQEEVDDRNDQQQCDQQGRDCLLYTSTGAITPVANLDPVQLAGTVVKRASLHNAEQIALLDIRLQDMVYVEKGGEIIPKITGVELSERPAGSRPFEFISRCPECGTELVKYCLLYTSARETLR